jgi:uncharacterized protein (DUF433 family)
MTTLQKAEQLLSELSTSEKKALFSLLARELETDTHVVKSDGILGGKARIDGTRIPVWLLVQYRNLGMSDSELLHSYPSLKPEDLNDAWLYYHHHKLEIDQQIEESETA